MGGGDLNMKKSWHPLLMRNQEKVWKDEQMHKEEQKRVEQLRREIEEERQLLELQRLQEAAGGKKRRDIVEWMYAVPNADGEKKSESEMEEYLLGRKRLDDLLNEKTEKQSNDLNKTEFIAVQNANSAQDIQTKVRLDPLLAIKKKEQDQLQAALQRKLYEKAKKQRRERDEYRAHSSHRSVSHRSRSRDDEFYNEKRRSSSRSPERERRRFDDQRHGRHRSSSHRYESSRSGHRDYSHARESSRHYREDGRREQEQERERRLQEMQNNAKQLEHSRSERVRILEAQEASERLRLAEEHREASKWDNQGEFIRKMKRDVYSGDNIKLEDRVQRGRRSFLRNA
ncbi:complexed with Cdc5 protein Cwf25 [Schizosaccharomyces japonicus yFS275]|uniref:Complexed with Cdc5 protein Cwf25 n=1 Tax=Schizosaccharomyces japonicus (strain yFS275 / FY16936) TaxID=402676 RepID=B6K5L7_SCHJY|nr:complexed with Cdc5 protein Cwf25 [Schizosaccharomyces japonicus yFS275]EEB08821.1 complexed with Cdc5 protein Cwf25 [Schizosaccharomyces japonicus yFS275]